MKEWPQKAYKWYREACDKFDYPAAPYGKAIKNLLCEGCTVLDVGCGIGAASVMMASLCRNVIALDRDKKALAELDGRIRENKIDNIKIICDSWPASAPIQADVVIALHVAHAMRSIDNLKSVFESAQRGFIACQAPVSKEEERFLALKEELGITPDYKKCDNGCFIAGALRAFGAEVKCEKAVYEFGQPLDTVEDAVRFVSWQIGADESTDHVIKKRIDEYAIRDGSRFFVPITRQSCAITFTKDGIGLV
jgi:SAM-dependent methyltransferase